MNETESSMQAKRREIEACRLALDRQRFDSWMRGFLAGNIKRLEREIAEDEAAAIEPRRDECHDA